MYTNQTFNTQYLDGDTLIFIEIVAAVSKIQNIYTKITHCMVVRQIVCTYTDKDTSFY